MCGGDKIVEMSSFLFCVFFTLSWECRFVQFQRVFLRNVSLACTWGGKESPSEAVFTEAVVVWHACHGAGLQCAAVLVFTPNERLVISRRGQRRSWKSVCLQRCSLPTPTKAEPVKRKYGGNTSARRSRCLLSVLARFRVLRSWRSFRSSCCRGCHR